MDVIVDVGDDVQSQRRYVDPGEAGFCGIKSLKRLNRGEKTNPALAL